MERLLVHIERLLIPLLAALLALITAGVFIQVLLRYLFATSFLWGEELSLFAFIWSVFLGSAICSRRHVHFSFDMFDTLLTGRAAAFQRLLVDLAVLAVTVLLVAAGWDFSRLSLQSWSPALGITLFVPTVIIPLAGALMLVVSVVDIARDGRALITGAAA
ncbi:TRAP transporter small permease [Piscinibacter sp.]|uniref:TRAP transporter small permease n=1 Tax=Piscinibacter sp. TaxID=1903157 RepID=UPI002C3B796F|nr:TRAP transporter small permease subunit [Albitalea sp.]HUG22510.1 TRAP transporter small permease subunit [Albitalea sp.]